MTDRENNVEQLNDSNNSTAYNSCPNLDISSKKFDKLFGKDGGCLTKDFKCANNDCNALFREMQNATSSEEAEISINRLLDTQNGGLTDNQKNEQIKALLCQLGNCKKPEKKKDCQFTEEKRNKHWRENPILVSISLILCIILFGLIFWQYKSIEYISLMFKETHLIVINCFLIILFTTLMGIFVYNSEWFGKKDCNLFLKFFFGYLFFGILSHNLFTSYDTINKTNTNPSKTHNETYKTISYVLAFSILIVIIIANFYLMIYTPEGLIIGLVAQKLFLTSIYKFNFFKGDTKLKKNPSPIEDKNLSSNEIKYSWLNSWQFLAMPILNFYLQNKGYPMCESNKNEININRKHTLNLGVANDILSGKKNQKNNCNNPVNSSKTSDTNGIL